MRSRRSSYRLYGLSLETRLSLPCPTGPRRDQPRISLDAGSPASFQRARSDLGRAGRRDWFAYRRLADRSSYLRWSGLFEFLVSPDGRRIRYLPLGHAGSESLHTYLLGHVLSFSLLALGTEPLHGTAVVIAGKAIGLLGDPASGKSTLGAALLARGHPLLTDDVLAPVAGRRGWEVHPGIPRLKLFPAVARRLLGREDGQPMNTGTRKRVLPLSAAEHCARRLPLAALYVLDGRPTARRVTIEPLRPADALLAVIRHTFNTIVQDRDRLANQLQLGSRLVQAVPVRRLTFPRRLASLPEVCAALVRDATG